MIHLARVAILLMVLLWTGPVFAVDPVPGCPGGHKCIPLDTFERVKAALGKLKKIETTQPTFTTEPVYIVVDRQGRIFSSGADPDPALGEMTWGDFVVKFKWTPKLTVSHVVEANWGYRPRIKTQVWANVLDADPLDVGLAFEPLYVSWANLQVFAGTKSFGLALGGDVTKNFGLVGGVALPYKAPTNPTPMAGLFFSFN